MDQQELGLRLKKARKAADISQLDAANAISVPRTAITQIESGKRSVSTLELTKLAELYQRSVMSFLEESDNEDEDLLVALYRMEPGLDSKESKAQVNKYVSWCRQGHDLEQLLGRDHRYGPPTYSEPTPRSISEAISQGEKVADQERKRLGIGCSPIPDMSELINEQGIWASGANFIDSISGLFLKDSSFGMAIFVNAEHVRARKRFSYAHEYAHALLDRDARQTVSKATNSSDLREKRANAFAAAFLMPIEGIAILLNSIDKGKPSRNEMSIFDVANDSCMETSVRSSPNSQRITYQDIALIAHHFGVSYHAAVFRLKSLGHISQKECDLMLDQYDFGKEYLEVLDMFSDLEHKEEKQIYERELRTHIVHLAIEAFRREEISHGKLREIGKSLDVPSNKLVNLANAACMN